ncbi:hypothetical protein KGF56_001581 [Candida oxycetoniae]|uniref:Fe2OG dioxygenase domain-containing protein n=1 Tax=Candida oxycetoniae TaxID=497107 RepID=A0AAI9SYJ0_9ASCO|nr:uncharacterized protein KGF56_001581 [Candida oxycetoniae]KAI3405563.2 hypothetical protein KGF56_001581 [Candida oxycetoniae]
MCKPNPLKIVDIKSNSNETPKEFLNALTTQGFVFIDGHDFTSKEVNTLFQLSKAFFELPMSYKEQFAKTEGNTGYISFNRENLDPTRKNDFKEGLNISDLNLVTGEPSSEAPVPDWIKEAERYELVTSVIRKFNILTLKLLELLAIGLNIDDTETLKGRDWFVSRYRPDAKSGSTLRFLHYPKLNFDSNPVGEVRAGAHTDYGSMTLLFQKQNQEGLEIFSQISGKWEKVPYIETGKFPGMAPPIVMNIGDLASYWTAGLLKSTIHRVRFESQDEKQSEDRYSIVFFSHPNDETLLEPVPSDLIKSRSKSGVAKDTKYITALQHLHRKLASTYDV